jgi:hypothetical protein
MARPKNLDSMGFLISRKRVFSRGKNVYFISGLFKQQIPVYIVADLTEN